MSPVVAGSERGPSLTSNCHRSPAPRRDTGAAFRRFPSPAVLPRPDVAVVCATLRFEQAAGRTTGAGGTASRSAAGEAGMK